MLLSILKTDFLVARACWKDLIEVIGHIRLFIFDGISITQIIDSQACL